MKEESDILLMNTVKNDFNYTGVGDKYWKRKTFLTITLLKLIEVIHDRTLEETKDGSEYL